MDPASGLPLTWNPGRNPRGAGAFALLYVSSGTSVSVTTPTAVSAGDTELLYVTMSNNAANAISTPAGWTLVTTQNSLPLQVAVFEKTATSADAGSAVSDSVTSAGPIAIQLVDYSHVGSSALVTAGASDTSTASHTAPAVTVANGGSWVVSFWSDKSSSTTTWTLPSGVTQRDQTIGTGGGHVTASGRPLSLRYLSRFALSTGWSYTAGRLTPSWPGARR